jgi:predicted oxidoreductase (fatty acid repression mutant protein)
MNFIEMIKNRRSVYELNKNLPVVQDEVFDLIKDCVRYVPDAFNMQSQRVVIVVGQEQDRLWDAVYDEMVKFTGGRFSRERTDAFAAAYGTVLYFYDTAVVEETRRQYPLYAENFHDWVMQSNGMLQFAVWTALRTIGVGANLQHYNPIIDNIISEMFDLPETWTLVGQMPFGGIEKSPDVKRFEDINIRVKIEK